MFKNKHVVTALIIAPILAITSYLITDYYLSEQPQKARAGGQYQLVQLPNCRYQSGRCGLTNGDFRIVITAVVGSSDQAGTPMDMFRVSDDSRFWQIILAVDQPSEKYLRIVLAAQQAIYYAETQMVFASYQTSFNKDFR